jgi:hypothetical protein
MYDVEVDEVFVVLQGVADVEVLDPSGLVSSTLPLRAGSVGRLRAGTRTRWTVQRTLRKIYVVADADADADADTDADAGAVAGAVAPDATAPGGAAPRTVTQ